MTYNRHVREYTNNRIISDTLKSIVGIAPRCDRPHEGPDPRQLVTETIPYELNNGTYLVLYI